MVQQFCLICLGFALTTKSAKTFVYNYERQQNKLACFGMLGWGPWGLRAGGEFVFFDMLEDESFVDS